MGEKNKTQIKRSQSINITENTEKQDLGAFRDRFVPELPPEELQNGGAKDDLDLKAQMREREEANRKLGERSAKVIREIKAVKPIPQAPVSGEKQKNAPQVPARKENLSRADKRRIVQEKIISYQEQLDQSEAALLNGYRGRPVQRTKYANAGSIEKKKRADEALRREANAARVEAFLARVDIHEVPEPDVRNSDMVKKEIDHFMKLAGKQHLIDTDENFTASLDANYELVKNAAMVQKMVTDAVDGGYMPKGVDMLDLQRKLAEMNELRFYMEVRIKIVKSPYYKYFAKSDVNYSTEQLDAMIRRYKESEDPAFKERNRPLAEYLAAVRSMRTSSLIRKRGLYSVSEKSRDKAIHEIELLNTRAEKREIIDLFSRANRNDHGVPRYLDKNYDRCYSREKLDSSLAAFEQVKLSDLHFKNLKDMAQNWEENARLFEMTKNTEHLLVCAVNKGEAAELSDDELMKLRAKIRAFDAMEKLSVEFQKEALCNSKALIGQNTYEELWEKVTAAKNIRHAAGDLPGYPKFGANLEKFYTAILKNYKAEHKQRRSMVKTMYGLMYPEINEEDEEEQGKYRPGEISEEERAKRVRDFQKNALLTDYARNANDYFDSVVDARITIVKELYQKKTGIDLSRAMSGPYRSMMCYMAGRSTQEIEKMFDILAKGSEQEKKELRRKAVDEIRQMDMRIDSGEGVKGLLENIAYKRRMGGVVLNLQHFAEGDDGSFDEAEKKEISGLYRVGLGQMAVLSGIGSNITDYRSVHGLTPEDLMNHKNDGFFAQEFGQWLSEEYLAKESRHSEYKADGRKYVDKENAEGFYKTLGTPFATCGTLFDKNGNYKNAEADRYAGFKAAGAWIETKDEELQELQAALQKEAPVKDLLDRDAAKLVLSADLSGFSLNSYKGMITAGRDGQTPLEKMVPLVRAAEKLLDRIQKKKLILFEFKEREMDELEVRCRLLQTAGILMGPRLGRMIEIYTKKSAFSAKFSSLDEMLHQPLDYYRKRKEKAKGEEAKEIGEIESFIRELNGYDVLSSPAIAERRIRRSLGVQESDLTPAVLSHVLEEHKTITNLSITLGRGGMKAAKSAELLGSLAPCFREKKLGVHEREALLSIRGGEQQKKLAIAKELEEKRRQVQGEIFGIKSKFKESLGTKLRDMEIENMSALMIDVNAGKQERIVDIFVQDDNIEFGLDRFSESIIGDVFWEPIGKLTPEKIVQMADRLEKFHYKAEACRNLLKKNPEYVKKLQKTISIYGKTDYVRLTEKLDEMLAYSDYYRSCRLLLSDRYYILHGNDELGRSGGGELTQDERRVLDLMKLVDRQAERINSRSWAGRWEEEDRLAVWEEQLERQAYLSGNPDLSKAKPKKVAAQNDNIENFLRLIGDEKGEMLGQLVNYKKEENPRAEKYRTEAVQNYIDGCKTALSLEAGEMERVVVDERKRKLKKKIKKVLGKKTDFAYKRSKFSPGDENLGCELQLQRFQWDLVLTLSDQASDEEILDIVQTLVDQREAADEREEKNKRDAWLRAVAKLYKLQFNELKRFERTYGTLPSDISPVAFMQALGAGQKDFVLRARFSQNFSQMCSDHSCLYKNRKVSLAEVLREEGLITEEELRDGVDKHMGYYQNRQGVLNSYIKNPGLFYNLMAGSYNGPEETISDTEESLVQAEYALEKRTFEGPGLSYGEKRKFWKEAFETERDDVYGNEEIREYNRKRYALMSKSEIRAIRERRAADKEILKKAKAFMDRRTEVARQKISEHVKDRHLSDAQRSMLKKMLLFYPGMQKEIEQKQGDQAEEAQFFENLDAFLGLRESAPKGKKDSKIAERKRQAFAYFCGKAKNLREHKLLGASTPEGLMGGDEREQDISLDSRTYLLQLDHGMYECLQDMAADESVSNWMDRNTMDSFRKDLFKNLRLEIVFLTMKSDYYLEANDIGGKRETVVAKYFTRLQDLERNQLDFSTFRPVELLADAELMGFLHKNGVRLDGLYETNKHSFASINSSDSQKSASVPAQQRNTAEEQKKAEEKKAEKEKAEEKKAEKEKAEKKKAEEKKAEEKKAEEKKAEEKKAEEKKTEEKKAEEEKAEKEKAEEKKAEEEKAEEEKAEEEKAEEKKAEEKKSEEKKKAEKPYEGTEELQLTELRYSDERGRLADKPSRRIPKENFERILGENSFRQQYLQLQESSAVQFADRFEEDMQGKTLERRLGEEYQKAFNGKDGIVFKGSRAWAATEKIAFQRHLQAEQERYLEQQDVEVRWFLESVDKKDRVGNANERILRSIAGTKESREFIRQWLVTVNKNKQDVPNSFLGESEFASAFVGAMKLAEQEDLTSYIYRDDMNFVNKFAYKYRTLCRITALADVMDRKEREIGLDLFMTEVEMSMLRAKADFARKLKEDYEARLKMISSPYYAIVAKKDIAAYLGAKGPEKLESARARGTISKGLYEYILLVRKAEELRYEKGRDANEVIEELRMEEAGRNIEQDRKDLLEIAGTLWQDVDFAELHAYAAAQKKKGQYAHEDVILHLLEKKREEERKSQPEDDIAFMKAQEFGEGVQGKALVGGMSADALNVLDVEIRNLLEGAGEFRGQEIREELRAGLQERLKAYVRCRRKLFASGMTQKKYLDRVMLMRKYYGFDPNNPILLQTQEGKDMQLVYDVKGAPAEFDLGVVNDNKLLSYAMIDVYYYLHENGYQINKKYEQIPAEKKEKILKHELEEYRRDIAHNGGRLKEFPRIVINGKEYNSYAAIPGVLGGEILSRSHTAYTVAPEKAKEAEELFTELEQYCREKRILMARSIDLIGEPDKGIIGLLNSAIVRKEDEKWKKRLSEILPYMKQLPREDS